MSKLQAIRANESTGSTHPLVVIILVIDGLVTATEAHEVWRNNAVLWESLSEQRNHAAVQVRPGRLAVRQKQCLLRVLGPLVDVSHADQRPLLAENEQAARNQ